MSEYFVPELIDGKLDPSVLPDGGADGAYPVQRVTVTGDLSYTPPGSAPTDQVVTVVFVQDAEGGHAVSFGSGVTLASGADWAPSTNPGSESVAVFRPGASGWVCEGCWQSTAGTVESDTTPPVAGTLMASAHTTTGFTLSVVGASDDEELHGVPFSFSTDNGATWSGFQASQVRVITGLDPGTTYTCVHRVSDAAGNVTVGAPITVSTLAADVEAPVWSATFTMGAPTPTGVTATASAAPTDNLAVTGYEVSYAGTWAPITPDGLKFALQGASGNTYSTTKLRARDAAGNTSTPALDVPAYTLPSVSGLASAILATSPEGYWPLTETGGLVASDWSGNSRDGAYSGAVTLAAQDGLPVFAGGAMTVPHNAAFSAAGSASGFTMFCVGRTDSDLGLIQYFMAKGTTDRWEWHTRASATNLAQTGIIDYQGQSVNVVTPSNTNMTLGAGLWNGVGFATDTPSFEASTSLYLNSGAPVGTSRNGLAGRTASTQNSPLIVGKRGDGQYPLTGSVGHVTVWRRRLSDTEMGTIMAAAQAEGLAK